MKDFTLGILQFSARDDAVASLERIKQILSQYSVNADLIILPEYSNADPTGLSRDTVLERAEKHGGYFTRGLEMLAEDYGVYILAGLLEREGECAYSSVLYVTPSSESKIVYRKRILFDALGVRESDILCPGKTQPPVLNLPFARIGLLVCFELRFPEIARQLALQGAEVVVAPTAWFQGHLKEEQLVAIAKTRAMENTVYLAIASQWSNKFTGRSIVVDPYGATRLDLGSGERYGEAFIESAYLKEVRTQLPLLKILRENLMKN
ncbi:carbon-nitrogen hydrolase family protein [Pyrofollis japonicus]|uniref:nitrilase-related carbon-nitrogen hydrolase n=1 Tax=Pyrofollis japonicus TaxID=3060460 RepID=UPI00295A6EB0|nr:nitrilase-related carbon-nitrogen hydrolase [Pyrofollis japonicus]BEP18264.1 carbon-nitrogen hydrolase family protein [Pyrofollis japonicus]